jgi:hypothetical protein
VILARGHRNSRDPFNNPPRIAWFVVAGDAWYRLRTPACKFPVRGI